MFTMSTRAAYMTPRLMGPKTEAVYRRYTYRQLRRTCTTQFGGSNRLTVTLRVTPNQAAKGSATELRRNPRTIGYGGMAEWSMAVVLKTTVPGRVPGVRIPLPPP